MLDIANSPACVNRRSATLARGHRIIAGKSLAHDPDLGHRARIAAGLVAGRLILAPTVVQAAALCRVSAPLVRQERQPSGPQDHAYALLCAGWAAADLATRSTFTAGHLSSVWETVELVTGPGVSSPAPHHKGDRMPTPPTAADLRRKARRLRRVNAGVDRAVTAMRRGASLHCTLRPHCQSARWFPSSGPAVSAEVVEALRRRPGIVAVGDALFAEATSQTWRLVEEGSGE